MPQDPDQLSAFKQRNEELNKQNQELAKQLEVIKKATEEFEKLREGATIEKIATEARNRVLGGLGILSIASIAGAYGIYTTAVNTIRDELVKPDTFKQIIKAVTDNSKEKVSVQVSEVVSKQLVETFKKDEGFQKNLTNAVADKILQDQGFIGTFKGIATTAADIAINNFAKGDPKSALSAASDKALSDKSFFVVAASSMEPNILSNLVSKANKEGLKAQICPPKRGNRRSVLLVTNTSSRNLTLSAAQAVQIKAKNINPTAYILPTEPASNVFFDPLKCK
jgi:hypothetical protein